MGMRPGQLYSALQATHSLSYTSLSAYRKLHPLLHPLTGAAGAPADDRRAVARRPSRVQSSRPEARGPFTLTSQARAAAIERGELSVEDPRDKMLREKKEKEKKEKAAARGAIPNSASELLNAARSEAQLGQGNGGLS
eukprot:scaffold40932_cov68-Phaeocystis_antarctica.AAC.2